MRTFVRFVVIAALGLAVLWLFGVIVDTTIYEVFTHYADALQGHLGINKYLAYAIELLFFVPFLTAVKYYLFSLNSGKRKTGMLLLLAIGTLYCVLMYGATRNEFFDESGNPIKFYALVPGGVEFSDRRGAEREFGVPFRPVTKDNITWLRRIHAGQIQVVTNPGERDWFDRVTGDALLFYVSDSNGNLRFYDGPGHDPSTQKELTPVTPAIRAEWEAKIRATSQHQAPTPDKAAGDPQDSHSGDGAPSPTEHLTQLSRRSSEVPRLVVFAGGRTIDRTNWTVLPLADSSRLDLGFSIADADELTADDEVQTEWYVDGDRKSHFNFHGADGAVATGHGYDNRPWPGSYEVRLLVNGRQVDVVRFTVSKNADEPRTYTQDKD
jgi:hypothetical protein